MASAAYGAAPLPGTKTRADRAAWRAILHWPGSCEQTWIQAGYGSGIGVWPVARGGKLVEVSCYLGAYQGNEMLYLATAGRRVVGPLPLLTLLNATTQNVASGKVKTAQQAQILGIVSFDSRRGELSVFAKFRGLGDCGTYAVYRLAGDRFEAEVLRAKPRCDAKPPFDPTRWPKVPIP